MTTFDPNTLSISFLLCTTITFTLTQAATFDIRNDCSFRLWAVADPGGSKQLDNGETWTFNTNLGSVKGRAKIWAQTNCNSNGNGGCQNYTLPPFTLAEYSVNHLNNWDFFDISLVKGFNVPMEFSPTSDGCSKGIKCVGDINEQCPQELLDPAGCNNACTVFENDQYCCRSTKCEPTIYSEFFKGLCPDAYSNPFDNATSTFTCPPGTNYTVVFCSTGTKTLPDTVQDYLNAHNRARAEVGVGPLSWDDNIATYAQDYANKHKGDCNLVHSGGPYGENLAGSSGSMTGVDAVNLWVGEKANYDYNSNTCAAGAVCGHYTQVVWRNSVRVGCGKVQCDNGGTFIGCNYDPRGNYVNEKPY